MKFLEKDLEDIIYENLITKDGREKLIDKDLDVAEYAWKVFRQVKIGNYGIADIVTINRCVYIPHKHRTPLCGNYVDPLRITIYELKKGGVSVSGFMQALRYAKGIRRFLNLSDKFNEEIYFDLVVIGDSIGNVSDLIYLPDFIDCNLFDVKFYTYHYTIDGLKFKIQEKYVLADEGFNLKIKL